MSGGTFALNRTMSNTTSSRDPVLRFFVSVTVAGAVCALIAAGWGQSWDNSGSFLNGVVGIVAVAFAAEVMWVSLHVGGSVLSVSFIPFLAGVFLFAPFWAMLLGGSVVFVVEALIRKKPWVKVVFNSSKEILALGSASALYTLLGGQPSPDKFNFSLLAIVAGGVAYVVVNRTAVSYAVSLAEGLTFGRAWSRISGASLVYDFLAIPVPAFLAYLYVQWQLAGVAILVIPLFIVRHIYSINQQLEQANRDLLELMVKNIEARDPYTSGHSQRVSQYARILARETGVSFRQVELIATAALLHDVGKTYSEYAPLLLKEGRLTSEEKNLLQTHPVRSAELVGTISTLRGPVEEAVKHHHENFDGTGYPDGLAGLNIPIGARIIMIADTLDAMTTDRPYRKALPFDRVVEEFRKYAAKQFDPQLVELVVKSPAIRRLVASETHTPLAPESTAFNRSRVARVSQGAAV
jgi:putative nucleotidyltransferase with HDIG domain